jgi:hypothetical protein
MIISPVRRTIAVLIGAVALAAPGGDRRFSRPRLAAGTSFLLTRALYLTDLTTSSVRVSWGTSAQFRE